MEAVRDYADRSQEDSFDRIVTLACGLLSTPVALFSVVETDRIWFKARHGLQIDHVRREPGFCSDAILQDSPWTVEDANSADAKGNRLVKEFGLTSYAGVPLAVKSGYKIGTLCVMDHPSRRFRAQELEILESLAALVVDRLELCRSAREARDAATRNDKATLRTTTRSVDQQSNLSSGPCRRARDLQRPSSGAGERPRHPVQTRLGTRLAQRRGDKNLGAASDGRRENSYCRTGDRRRRGQGGRALTDYPRTCDQRRKIRRAFGRFRLRLGRMGAGRRRSRALRMARTGRSCGAGTGTAWIWNSSHRAGAGGRVQKHWTRLSTGRRHLRSGVLAALNASG